MKYLTVLIAALVFAMGTMTRAPEAEARRGGGGLVAGIVAAAVIGGIVAASLRKKRRHVAYYPRRTYYYGPSYAYAQPVYVYRSRPVYRAGFLGPRRGGYYRRWR